MQYVFSSSNLSQKRRDTRLSQQRSQRKQVIDAVRRLVDEAVEDTGEIDALEGAVQTGRSPSTRKRTTAREFYAKQLQIPEWLVAMPQPLHGHWLVRPRPEGRPCVVVSSRGRTISRLRTGDVLHRFQSVLPDGGHTAGVPGGGHCILDCIFHEVCAAPCCMTALFFISRVCGIGLCYVALRLRCFAVATTGLFDGCMEI